MEQSAKRAWFDAPIMGLVLGFAALAAGVALIAAVERVAPSLGLWAVPVGFAGPALVVMTIRNAWIKRERARGQPAVLTGSTFAEMRAGARIATVGIYKLAKWLLIGAAGLAVVILAIKAVWYFVSGVWSLV